jgi:predicted amidophosphoribosyltransferase
LLIDDILTAGATLKDYSREMNKIDGLCLSIAAIVNRN